MIKNVLLICFVTSYSLHAMQSHKRGTTETQQVMSLSKRPTQDSGDDTSRIAPITLINKKYPQLCFSLSDNIRDVLIGLFAQENKRVIGACYNFDSYPLKDAWIKNKRLRDGKKDALIIDSNQQKKSLHISDQLMANGIQVLSPQSFHNEMHHKFLIFYDNGAAHKKLVVSGSYNLTNYAEETANNICILDDAAVIKRFKNEFNILKQCSKNRCDRPNNVQAEPDTSMLPQVYFSPSINRFHVIQNFIGREQQGIKAAFFKFTGHPIAGALNNHNVRTELVIDKDFNGRNPYPCGALCGALRKLTDFGYPVWVSNLKQMHHKMLLFEKNINNKKLIMTGSYNITGKAKDNWENICIFEADEEVYRKFNTEFQKLKADSRRLTSEDVKEPWEVALNHNFHHFN